MNDTVHIVVAMKPLDGNFVQNALQRGVAGLNIGASRFFKVIGGGDGTSEVD